MCGRIMEQGDALDLDHQVPRVLGGVDGPKRIVHRSCNTSEGGKLGASLRWAKAKEWKSRW
jgi:hypothetical protein